jgi:DNA-binding XRE family transcriptional regulator
MAPRPVVTLEQIERIAAVYQTGDRTQTELAREYGVSISTISKIVRTREISRPWRSPEVFMARYLSKVDRRGPNECWPWMAGTTTKFGYGSFKWKRSSGSDYAHVYTYEQFIGPVPLPPNNVIRHTCDNPPCQNPSHLINGTHADNIQDQLDRGRNAFGERNGHAKLTENDVRVIRATYVPKMVTQQFLANQYGVSRETIKDVLLRKVWSHVG